MAYPFGDGTKPENLLAELDWPSKQVCFCVLEDDHGVTHKRSLCEIPLSQLLFLREYLGEEVARHLRESEGEHPSGCMG